MGNCVTLQKNSAMEFKYSDPPAKSIEIESPVKETIVYTAYAVPVPELNSITQHSSLAPFDRSFPDMSDRDEMFFDSQPWLDSDCEDYLSVNGDNTPSCGTTPVHHSSCIKTSAKEKPPFVNTPPRNSPPETPPTKVEKQLIELFRESFGRDQDEQGSQGVKPIHLYPKSADRSPYESRPHSTWSTETTPNRGSKVRKQPRAYSPHRCLPNLMRSFSERKRRLSPARSVGAVKPA